MRDKPSQHMTQRQINVFINPPVASPLVGGYSYGLGVPFYGGWGRFPFSFFTPGPSVAVGVGAEEDFGDDTYLDRNYLERSTLGQGLQTCNYLGESIFSIALAIFELVLFAFLIGNMQFIAAGNVANANTAATQENT